MNEQKARALLDPMVGEQFLYNGKIEHFERYEINNEKGYAVITTNYAAFRRHPLHLLRECLAEYKKPVAIKKAPLQK